MDDEIVWENERPCNLKRTIDLVIVVIQQLLTAMVQASRFDVVHG